MPRFITNGPVVPDQLVQDLEDDRVVIFCGAGVSKGAGLPDYQELVQHCYTELGRDLPPKRSPEWIWLDRMLGDLEGGDGADQVREHVAKRLDQPPRHLDMHKAIIRLARLRGNDGLRLVTTNYDHYFENAAVGLQIQAPYHSAPVLPIPKNDVRNSWRSIVYLHGRLENPEDGNGHLVLTSADFGRAYLTDAWAARFVARLFADFTVLFLGYSLNDPVLRYMTDAFAAERSDAKGVTDRNSAYIFIPYRGKKAPDPKTYRNRRLEPIFYHDYRYHSRLLRTIVAWAKARDNYLVSTSALIKRIAPKDPRTLDPSDTANLLWAVLGRRNDSGHGARVFASLSKPAPIEWFDEFERIEAESLDAHAAMVKAAQKAGTTIPAAPDFPCRSLFPPASDRSDPSLSETSGGLIQWFLLHLGSQGFVDRVIAQLGRNRRLHGRLKQCVRSALSAPHTLKSGYARFWQIVSADGSWNGAHERPLVFLSEPADTSLYSMQWWKQEILYGLSPAVHMKPPYPTRLRNFGPESDAETEETGNLLRDVAETEITLCGENTIDYLTANVTKRHGDAAFWAKLLPELTQLLIQTLDLYQIVSDSGPLGDPAIFKRPSIVPHAQNRHYDKWTHLIDFMWQGWEHLAGQDDSAARAHLQVWATLAHPTFERLTLAGLAHLSLMPPRQKLDFLLHGEAVRLWSSTARKETFDLLVAVWPVLHAEEREELATAILVGPSAVQGSPTNVQRRDRQVFDRLALLERSGDQPLPSTLGGELSRIRALYPEWDIPPGDRAHFSMYRQESYRVNVTEQAPYDSASVEALSSLLGLHDQEDEDGEDLSERIRRSIRKDPSGAISTLRVAVHRGDAVSGDVWLYSLQALREVATDASLREAALHLLIEMPQPALDIPALSSAAADLIEAIVRHGGALAVGDAFWRSFDRTFVAAALDDRNADKVEPRDDWVSLAINRSMGVLATALLNAAFSMRLSASSGLQEALKARIGSFVHATPAKCRPGRVIIASRLSYLFAVDPAWTKTTFLPLFDWSDPLESAAVWEGFAWQATIDEQLWEAINPLVFESFIHQRANSLSRHSAETIAQILPLAGIEYGLRETPRQATKTALRQMTGDMRKAAARWISDFMEATLTATDDDAAGERADKAWTTQVAPWIKSVWPMEPELRDVSIAKRMAVAAISTRAAFPAAVRDIKQHLLPCSADSVLEKLAASTHPSSHPAATLELLEALVAMSGSQYDMANLRSIVEQLSGSGDGVTSRAAYLRWQEYVGKQR